MGMYDSFVAETKCPVCKRLSDWEFQTKELKCEFNTYCVGDHVPVDFPNMRLSAVGSCPLCHARHMELFDEVLYRVLLNVRAGKFVGIGELKRQE